MSEDKEEFLEMEDSEARETPKQEQTKPNKEGTGYSISDVPSAGGDAGPAAAPDTGGGASDVGGSTGEAGGASQGGGSGN